MSHAFDLLDIDVPQDKEHHARRVIEPANKALQVLATILTKAFGIAQNVAAKRMIGEEELVEIVVDEFRRRVVVTLYLIDDHLHLAFQFALGIGAVEGDIEEQVEGSGEVLPQGGTVIDGMLLTRVGIQVASYSLHAIDDVPRTTALCALK